jgi:UDP-2-acetamido-3-amino-2,3-dideoxy-glucuronate N-acetyltransferase
MVGVPARQVGWMSAFGVRVELSFQGQGSWSCPQTCDLYGLSSDHLMYYSQQS